MKVGLRVLLVLSLALCLVGGSTLAKEVTGTNEAEIQVGVGIELDELVKLTLAGDHNHMVTFEVEPEDWPNGYVYAEHYDNFVHGGPEDGHYINVQALIPWELNVSYFGFSNWYEIQKVHHNTHGNAGVWINPLVGGQGGTLASGYNTAGTTGVDIKVKHRLNLKKFDPTADTSWLNVIYLLTGR